MGPVPQWLFLVAFLVLSLSIVGVMFFVTLQSLRWLNSSDSQHAVDLRRRLGFGRSPTLFFPGDGSRQSTDSAREFAKRRSAHYEQRDDTLLPRLAPYRLLFHDSSAELEDVVTWRDKTRQWTLASYAFNLSDTTYYGILFAQLERRLPSFLVRGRTWFQLLANSRRNIEIADDPAFSKWYQLEGEDEASVRRLFNAPVRGAFNELESCAVEAHEDGVLFLAKSRQLTLEEREQFFTQSRKLLEALERASV